MTWSWRHVALRGTFAVVALWVRPLWLALPLLVVAYLCGLGAGDRAGRLIDDRPPPL